jgi:AcrR family transcriptional regulator
MTTRRLAEKVEYSQPVLYSHFAGKDAIMAAVAVEGIADLAEELRTARASVDAEQGLAAVSKVYTSFAERRPTRLPREAHDVRLTFLLNRFMYVRE